MERELKCVLLFLLLASSIYAQKTLTKTWNPQSINSVVIDAPWAHSIVLIGAAKRNTIEATHHSEGEYQNGVSLAFQENENQLILEEILTPAFNNPQDKLSAHKHIASTLTLYLPYALRAKVFAKEALLTVKGQLKQIDIQMQSGSITLFKGIESGHIKTHSAHVVVKDSLLSVSAKTRLGKLEIREHKNKEPTFFIETLKGNIKQY